ncbi:LOW QUALITY PROTEIN: coiled-coil domain-containing protein 181 [Prinia subflava]|uniref:LOW QUALITY PROTEIN: coiled-coil domain-containing protein 181 n=1 Tax=Prinia subflava TaxID=208062 RepID=UPI002FE3288B
MSEKEDQADVGDLTKSAEYEDDFEKDPECLTDEEEKQNPDEKETPEGNEEDVEAQTDKAADSAQEDIEETEENPDSEADVDVKVLYSNEKYMKSRAGTEQKDHESERQSPIQESKVENEQELDKGEDEEANDDLENQASADQSGGQKLKVKDEMGQQASPPEDAEAGETALVKREDFSVELSQLHISDDKKRISVSERAGSDEEIDDIETQQRSPRSRLSSSLPTASQMKETPPSDSKDQPDSALNGAKDLGKQQSESAGKSVKGSTYTLTPRQKELRKQIEIRKERLRREEEARKREIEELRRRENELVFRAWLLKKKQQLQQEKRNRRAKQLEELRMKEVNRDPEEAYRLWLKKKHQQYMKEKRIELLRRQTEEVYFFPSAEECDRAFRDWLRRKREEKQAAELAAKERIKQINLEARRARKLRNINYINSEPESFCFIDHYN